MAYASMGRGGIYELGICCGDEEGVESVCGIGKKQDMIQQREMYV